MPDDVARNDDVTMSLPSTEANPHPLPIVDWPLKQEVLEIKQAFAAIGEKPEDVPTKPIAHGATLRTLVAPEKAKEKVRRAKAKAKEKVKARAKVKEKVRRERKADLDHARLAAEHHREMARLLVDDRLLKTQRKCVSCTQKESVRKVMQSAHSYAARHASGTRQADVEMGQNACSRTERREECLPCSKHHRRN